VKKKPKILIIKSKYNDTEKLSYSAESFLKQKNINFKKIEVDGSFEIPSNNC